MQYRCKIPCRQCTSCNKRCPDFVDYPCQVENKAPYVCNGCNKSISCLFDKYLYNAGYAQREYEEKLRKSREGINLTKAELIALDELVTPLIKKGQPIAHIMSLHKDEIPCSERTLYSYISNGYLTVRNLDMRRKVRYKKRVSKQPEISVSPAKKLGHLYQDFLKGRKVLQTFFWRKEKLMLAFILESKEMKHAVRTIDKLEKKLGKDLFSKILPLILADNGSEFVDSELFEFGKDGNRRTCIVSAQ